MEERSDVNQVRTSGRGEVAAALDVAAVSHFYGRKRALNNVSFSIAPASFTVLLGLNGAGKTTLFSLISHLYNTRQGSIRIFGHDIGRASGEALRRIAELGAPASDPVEGESGALLRLWRG